MSEDKMDWVQRSLQNRPLSRTALGKQLGLQFWCHGSDPDRDSDSAYHRRMEREEDTLFRETEAVAKAIDEKAKVGVGEISGGCGDDFSWAIILASPAALYYLFRNVGLAVTAAKKIRELFDRLLSSEFSGWEANLEVLVLECYRIIAEDYSETFTTAPELVDVLLDGEIFRDVSPQPTGRHLIRIPDLGNKKTHLFVIDNHLEIYNHTELDGLTADAETWLTEAEEESAKQE